MEQLQELTGHQVVGVLRERYAAEARAHAATLEAVWETVRCADPDSTERMTDPDEWSSDEVRAALGLTRAAASRLVGEAHDACHRLPELGAAMAAGELDPARARVIAEWVTDLSAEHAHGVCADVLPLCQLSAHTRLTTGQLAEAIKTRAIALDPEWARRRYERSLQDRKVVASRTPDGTARLSGTNLPLDRVATSAKRLDDLARRAKRAGDPRPIDHVRADLFLGMTDGSYVGLDDDQILHALLHPVEPAAQPAEEPPPEPSWAGVHLKVRLSTLLDLDRYPAEVVGWGSCHAELARHMVRQLGAAQWRYTFTCPEGYLIRTGLLSSRPTGVRKRRASCEAVIEILVPAEWVRTFSDANLDPAWAPVLFDLKEKLADPATTRLFDPRRRAPGAALRREVVAALDHCIHPGCRAPAGGGDLDHRREHARGGATVAANLNPLCRHDHRVKGEAGWQLHRVGDAFQWTTRLGHVYVVPVPKVLLDLPVQRPSPVEDDLLVNPERDRLGEPWQRSTAWDETRYRRAGPASPTSSRPPPHPDYRPDDPLRLRKDTERLGQDPDDPAPF